jgi:hypothetical protein
MAEITEGLDQGLAIAELGPHGAEVRHRSKGAGWLDEFGNRELGINQPAD